MKLIVKHILLVFFASALLLSCGEGDITGDIVVNEPGIKDFSPKSGAPGSEVVISGGGFSDVDSENVVEFAGTPADTILQAGRNKIYTLVPSGAQSGPITVKVSGNTFTSDSTFTVE